MWRKLGKRKDRTQYKGHYLRDANGERVFVLVGLLRTGRVRTVTFESPKMAMKVGWTKV